MPAILPQSTLFATNDGRGGSPGIFDDDALLQFRLVRNGRSPVNEFALLLVLSDASGITVLAKRMGTVGPPVILTEPDPHLFPSDGLLARLSCL